MKKLLLFVAASLLFVASATAATVQPLDPPKKEQDIPITDKTPPTPPMTTSAQATVEAHYTTDLALLEIWFNRNVGTVTVSVTDNSTGRTLTRYTCDSSLEPQVCLNVALEAGFYTLHIIGSDYEGYGDFDL
ncbi:MULTISPECIES: DUF3244 domain-containing protein [unclassified Alistipes]|mgnify:FL=1|uniref:DUF3244 domain-containing protein n=1 Tax=unclassified Alistipes TaxID=2608932 RepID=UPI0007A80168|nr:MULTISPECIES: DUF3244 domain-containing protein [unclassified Alistipes]CVI66376.1 hypothetical protein BN3659_00500 [Alistipes sp. CHKCI003]